MALVYLYLFNIKWYTTYNMMHTMHENTKYIIYVS